jgi:Family of unknown function (DUF5947)
MTSGLRRFVGRSPVEFAQRVAAPTGEACEMCAAPISDQHQHVVNLERRNLVCACRPCYLLFARDGAGRGNYRSVPDRYLAASAPLTQAQWDALQVPVGMAFFFRNSLLGRVVALYPGPAGATESLLDLGAWADIAETTPLAQDMQDDVEALLVRRDHEDNDMYLVPIDACYELVGLLRLHWTGFDGGPEAQADIAAFFERVRARAGT